MTPVIMSRHVLQRLYQPLAGAEHTAPFRWEPSSIAIRGNRPTCRFAPAELGIPFTSAAAARTAKQKSRCSQAPAAAGTEDPAHDAAAARAGILAEFLGRHGSGLRQWGSAVLPSSAGADEGIHG